MKQKVLIVDDSPFIRRLLTDWIKNEADFEVVGTAANGNEAVALANQLKPDVITMDVEMPIRDGISALEEIMDVCPTAVLMVSSITTQGAAATLRALELGAYDFVTKPQGSNSLKFIGSKDELVEKLREAKSAKLHKTLRRSAPVKAADGTGKDRVVLIASSTGGPRALANLWEGLPKGFEAAILMVQHMPAGFTESLAKRLDSMGTVPCREAKHGDVVTPGQALLAPGGKHMIVRSSGQIELTNEPPIHGVRPAADHLFLSAAGVFGKQALGVVLTGMGKDGAEGAVTLRKVGAKVYGESEDTCTIYGMPKAAKNLDGIDAEFGIHEMASAIVAGLKERNRRAA
jgi:two-component system, chemotaxis family, protein-glutamate methylesterase/glutaminase